MRYTCFVLQVIKINGIQRHLTCMILVLSEGFIDDPNEGTYNQKNVNHKEI